MNRKMSVWEAIMAIIIAIAGGSAGAAFITSMNERWKFKATRKAANEDKADRTKKLEDSVSDFEHDTKALQEKMAAQSEAMKLILLDRILYLGQSYIKRGEITLDERRRINEMYRCYHSGLGGNGDADFIISAVDELELKK
jgi:hypothetical protein